MPRYFIEISYKGTAYFGFQVQKNANSIQAEIEKALSVFFKKSFSLTGSSRTDAGVHALQNYFHFDTEEPLFNQGINPINSDEVRAVYNLNAILPLDIVIKRIFRVEDDFHCRFDAVSRQYKYFIFGEKNPFLQDRAFYYPYKIDINRLNEAAEMVLLNKDFTTFSKRNTQVKHFLCDIKKSFWIEENDMLVYSVESNRFLRGMVKGLVGTMLRIATHKISLEEFNQIIQDKDCRKADFSVPSHGLFLIKVTYDRI
ncbi:MAG TPA: tRNA pseudouridine(38-40) synthase TruA [Hanamia sp.]|nr:tRNA pseudouridine(38-40) synthase TruA [Hanamia sp.]